jgi:FAD/FMN-containing dehydrogenase
MAKLDEKAVQDLRAQVRGDLIRPVDGTLYEEARKVYNGMIDRRPAIIVRCVNVADVIASVNFARKQKLPLAVRGSGHSGPGLCTVDEGLVIDLSQMRGIRVDPEARTVRVEGGARWGDVDHATRPFAWPPRAASSPRRASAD